MKKVAELLIEESLCCTKPRAGGRRSRPGPGPGPGPGETVVGASDVHRTQAGEEPFRGAVRLESAAWTMMNVHPRESRCVLASLTRSRTSLPAGSSTASLLAPRHVAKTEIL